MNSLQYNQDLITFESTSIFSNIPISDYIQKTLTKLGFSTERLEYEDDNGVQKVNIIGKKGEGYGGMAYFGHTDVVPADPWFTKEHGAFSPIIKENKLYGRGSCDMKGSIACMMAAVEQVSEAELKKPIYITCTADEEIGYGGAKHVAQNSKYYREMVDGESHGIIGEPTMLEVVYAHKGTYGFVATSKGKAAHSSTREGINANLAIIPFLTEMKKIHDETENDPSWHNDEFAPPTLSWNIGINDNTKAINITPPQSVCTVYFRPMPGQNAEILIERARKAAEKNGIEFDLRSQANSLYVDPKSEFVKEVLQLTGKTTPRTVSYGTDGTMLSAMKKIIVFGPGDIAQAHTHDEWIDLDQLEKGTKIYSKLIRHWCC